MAVKQPGRRKTVKTPKPMPKKVAQSHIGGARGTKKGIPQHHHEAFTFTSKDR